MFCSFQSVSCVYIDKIWRNVTNACNAGVCVCVMNEPNNLPCGAQRKHTYTHSRCSHVRPLELFILIAELNTHLEHRHTHTHNLYQQRQSGQTWSAEGVGGRFYRLSPRKEKRRTARLKETKSVCVLRE